MDVTDGRTDGRTGNSEFQDAIGGLLSALGFSGSQNRDSAQEVAEQHLTDMGFSAATVANLRYGVLVIECDAVTARLLRYQVDDILEEVRDKVGDAVTSIRVRVVT